MSTEIVKRNESLVKISRAVDKNGVVDLSLLSDEDRERCRRITSKIKDNESLMSFGSDLAKARGEASSQLLQMHKVNRSGKNAELLHDVYKAIKGVEYKDPSKMTGIRGFIAKYIPGGVNLVKMTDEKFIDSYNVVKTEVGKIQESMSQQQIELKEDYNLLDDILLKTVDYIDQLGIMYVSLAQFYQDKKDELEGMKKENEKNPGTYSVVDLQQAQLFLEDIEKQGYELYLAGYHSQMNLVPEILTMKKTTNELIRNSESIIRHVIPNWETEIAQAIIAQKSKDALELQKLCRDKNNEMIKANAELIGNTAIEMAKESSRGSFDVDALSEATNTILSKLEEAQKISKEQRSQLVERISKLEQIKKECKTKLTNAVEEFNNQFYVQGEDIKTSKSFE